MIFWNPGSRDVFSFSSAKNNGGGWFLWKKHRFCCKCMYFPKAWFHRWHLYISTIAGNLFTISIKTSRATSSIGSWWLSTLSYLLNFFAFYFAEKKNIHLPSDGYCTAQETSFTGQLSCCPKVPWALFAIAPRSGTPGKGDKIPAEIRTLR